jgi:putative restriction endonuclease
MILVEPFSFGDCKNVWSVGSVERVHELYLFVLNEARKGDESKWNLDDIPKSYLQKGYCSAALRNYQEFLVEYNYEQNILNTLANDKVSEDQAIRNLKTDIDHSDYLIEGLDEMQGEDVLRTVRARANQNVFREMILKIYSQSCCITGLNIPEINRASHIVPWASDESLRLDPRNGLCLSATYDAAFDRNLISLDDDYRIILSKDIKEYYTNDSVKEYFLDKEGTKITLPSSYVPQKDYLEKHRSNGKF